MQKILFILIAFITLSTFAQDDKVKFGLYDSVFTVGYVDNGAFLNFTGPNISTTFKNSKISLGMLPSLRFEEDKGTPKNVFVTPNLGVGLTYCYKIWAFQIPIYYNPKNRNCKRKLANWIGNSLRLNELNEKK